MIKENKNKGINFRVTDKIYIKLMDKIAQSEYKNQSELLNFLITDWMEKENK